MPRMPNGTFAESEAEYASRLRKTIMARDVQIHKLGLMNAELRTKIAALRTEPGPQPLRASQHRD